jgi:WhiB family redox-sensing transcriptional regulator
MSEFYKDPDYPDFEEFGEPPCASSYPDAFFADDFPDGMLAKRPTYTMEKEAKQTCFSCDYRQQCLLYALKHPELQGIWGGTTEKQRRAMLRGQPVKLGLPPSRHR